ncbi:MULTISPECIES: ABC transporter permease subunit [unclassified Bacillus (in: firmicutes)]|uniref:ABC transporter permease subunit n=1 Tax=unclassified Bacillus (in: firmicutes) TaxID=185979 RepID=UPI003D254B83
MSKALLVASLKANAKMILNYAVGSVLYLWLLIWIFPSFSSVKGLDEILKAMPQGVLKAVGFEKGIEQLNDFLAGEYYGLIFVLLLMIYSILASTQLVAHLVDRGSMAYLLSTSVSRTKVILTQASVLIIGLFTIVIATYLGGLVGAEWLIEKVSLDQVLFFKLNLLGGLVFLVICAYSFFFSCLFDDEKKALSISTGITVLFYGLDMLGKLSDKLDWMRKLSIFNLYRPQEIVDGSYNIWPSSIGLLAASFLLFIAAIMLFKRRDLPL